MKFFQIIPDGTNIDFIGKFKIFAVGSALLVAAVIVLAFTKGFNFGIDFTGGTVEQLKFSEPKQAAEVRSLVGELGDEGASVVSMGEGNQEYLITSRTLSDVKADDLLHRRLVNKVGADKVTILQADVVGPKVGAELKASALKSLFYSIVLIMIYVWFRFDFRFAPGATVAMIHDLILACGFYIISGTEFTITSIAALLTIAGYSVNDTIVIYDRVRELLKAGGEGLPIGEVINRAINLTLSRTILTSGVTFLSVIPIAVFCTGEIQAFAIAILVGVFVGSYSTIYIAAPFTIYAQRYLATKKVGAPRTGSSPARA